MALQSADRVKDETERLGRFLVAHLFILLKTSQNYSEGHAALQAPLANLMKVLAETQRRNLETALRLRGESLYLGDVALKPESSAFHAYRFVIEEMKSHQLGGIWFAYAVTPEEVRKFVYALREVDADLSPDPYGRLLERMQRRVIANVEVEAYQGQTEKRVVDGEKLRDRRVKARILYTRGVAVIQEVVAAARAGQPLRLREAKRVVQNMIDLLFDNGATLLGLTTLHRNEANSYNHAVNVCILSLALGKRAGMSKLHLCELGMAALFHNVGKSAFPAELAQRPGERSAAERQALEGHPIHGVMKMLKLKALDTMSSRIISGVFEHHLLADFSGFPRFPYNRLGLHGRIISIVDRYDVLTSSWIGSRPPLPPDKALRLMLSKAGKAYDAVLLKLLVACLGMHGIGSLLLLESRELAVVVESNPDPARWDTPRVKIIADRDGREVDGDVVELSDSDTSRTIVAILDPHPFKVHVSRYFM